MAHMEMAVKNLTQQGQRAKNRANEALVRERRKSEADHHLRLQAVLTPRENDLEFLFRDKSRALDFPRLEERYRDFLHWVLEANQKRKEDEPLTPWFSMNWTGTLVNTRDMSYSLNLKQCLETIYSPPSFTDRESKDLIMMYYRTSRPLIDEFMMRERDGDHERYFSRPLPADGVEIKELYANFFHSVLTHRFCGTRLVVPSSQKFRQIYSRAPTQEDIQYLPRPPFTPKQALIRPEDSKGIKRKIKRPVKKVPLLVDPQILQRPSSPVPPRQGGRLDIRYYYSLRRHMCGGSYNGINFGYFSTELPQLLILPEYASQRRQFTEMLLRQDGTQEWPILYPVQEGEGVDFYRLGPSDEVQRYPARDDGDLKRIERSLVRRAYVSSSSSSSSSASGAAPARVSVKPVPVSTIVTNTPVTDPIGNPSSGREENDLNMAPVVEENDLNMAPVNVNSGEPNDLERGIIGSVSHESRPPVEEMSYSLLRRVVSVLNADSE